MDRTANSYCRFCAEPKNTETLLSFEKDSSKHEEISLKLAFMNALYVDVASQDNLPKTVCLMCYDSFNKAYEFLVKVRRAQDVLSNLFTRTEENYEDDKNFDDLLIPNLDSGETKDTADVKSEVNYDATVEVKMEPNDDVDNSLSDNKLNVQDIIDAAIGSPSNIELYASDDSNMSVKELKSWKDYPWVCIYCNIEFLDADMLRSHSKLVHGKCSAFMCIDCKTRQIDYNVFIKHVRKHEKNLRYRCHYCDLQQDSIKNLDAHVSEHFLKSQVPCQACGEILEDEESLKSHLEEFTSVKPKRKPRRKPGTPITIEELTCNLCKKVYKNPNSLRDHMKLHTNDRKRNYTCERCGKTFYSKGSLTSHILSHSQERPHICKICNKSFLFPNMLRRHVEMHSGVKPFSCEQCGRCFRLQYQLNTHKIVHTNSMPHVCQFCSKAFRYKQILKTHERLHTGAKPYSCQHCSMGFGNWSNYNKHMKRRHGIDTAKKKITPEGVFPVNPETGQIIAIQDPIGTEEWKSKIMVPGKRGRRKKDGE